MSVTDVPSSPRQAAPTGGVDWAKDNHAVAVVGPDGQPTDRFSVEHTVVGLRTLVRRLLKAGKATLLRIIAPAGKSRTSSPRAPSAKSHYGEG